MTWLIGVDEDGDALTEPRLVENEDDVEEEQERFAEECPDAVSEVKVVNSKKELVEKYGCEEEEIEDPSD